MRRGVALINETLIQLIVAALVIGLIWVPVTDRIITGDTFRESAYATDNALTLEAMQISDRGNMQVAYLFQSEQFFFTVDKGIFTASTAPKGGVARHFLLNQDTTVEKLFFQPNFFQYQHIAPSRESDDQVTPGELRAVAQTYRLECPRVTISPGWPQEGRIIIGDTTTFSKDIIIQQTIRTAISQAVGSRAQVEIMPQSFEQQKYYSILVTSGDSLLADKDPWVIRYQENDEASRRLACTIAKELSELNEDIIHTEARTGISEIGGIEIFVPEGFAADMNDIQQRELQRAINAGTVRFLEGST